MRERVSHYHNNYTVRPRPRPINPGHSEAGARPSEAEAGGEAGPGSTASGDRRLLSSWPPGEVGGSLHGSVIPVLVSGVPPPLPPVSPPMTAPGWP